jgi:hypothetical protein
MDAKVRKKNAAKPFKSPFGYAMPHLSPLYTPPPFEYRDAHSMMIVFESDPKVLARYVPKPLVLDPKATMFAQISRFFTAGFGSYHEILLAAHAHFQGRPVNYSLSLILDNDIAICGGREIWGFPKKLGRVTLSDKDGVMSGTVERGGLPLVRGAMQIGDFCSPAELAGSAEYVQQRTPGSDATGFHHLAQCGDEGRPQGPGNTRVLPLPGGSLLRHSHREGAWRLLLPCRFHTRRRRGDSRLPDGLNFGPLRASDVADSVRQ